MARLKTVEYWFPMLATVVDATDTNLTQITVYLPETGTKTFRSVFLEVTAHDLNTTLGNVSRRQCSVQLGSAGYSVVNNTNAIANGGEQQTILFSGDFTSYFNTNWSGTSMTCDARVLLDSAVASPLNPAFNNVSARLVVTYEYDETSTTHVKTVRIPLNAPVGAVGTSQPGTATATIPALDTELPEASKVYRQIAVVTQGNDNGASTDISISHRVGSGTTFTSQVYEHGSNCAMFTRQNSIESFDTSVSQSFYLWGSAASWHHQQAWLVVTYEFDASAANDVFVSLLVPMEMDSPMGGTTSSDYQRAARDLWIQEPATITTKQVAAMVFWDALAAIGGMNFRVGTGSFVTYTDAAAVLAGSNAAMVRNDAAFSLARGRNALNFDAYRTDTADLGYNVGVLWMVNYTCGKPAAGHGAENHTVLWGLKQTGTVAASQQTLIAATSVAIPETSFFFTAIGIEYRYVPSGTVAVAGAAIQTERLASGEGGLVWEAIYADLGGTDGETGIYHAYATARAVFQRWPGDTVDGLNRLDIETSRRWRLATAQSVATFDQLTLMLTYHSITFTCADSISGFSGTVDLTLHRENGEAVLGTSRSGDGAFSFTWYDNTEELYVMADDGTHVGRSALTLAAGSP